MKLRSSKPWWIACCVAAALAPFIRAASGPEWNVEIVDRAGTAKSVSMKADSEGNLHIAFIADDGDRYPLKYAFWDRAINRWFVMEVANMAATTALALDSKRRPHIAYVDHGTASGCKLRYLKWNGAAWEKQGIPLNSDIVAYYTSIALDREDRPSLSFYEYRGPKDSDIKIRLRNVTLAEGQWQVRTLDPQEGSGKFNCTASDSNGNIHVAYANVAAVTSGVRYAVRRNDRWKSEIVETIDGNAGEAVGYSTCLTVDRNGDPHLTYSNQSRPSVRYAVRKQDRWRVQVIDTLLGVGYPDRNSIAVDANNKPFVSYFDAGKGELRLAYPEAGTWNIEVVDSGGAGFTSAVEVHGQHLYLAYGDVARAALKVARRTIPAMNPAGQP